MEKKRWVVQWKQRLSAKAALPGVWRREEGGFFIRGRAKDPVTGRLRTVARKSDAVDARAALAELDELRREIRAAATSIPILFGEYSAQLFERKLALNEIRSAVTREQWAATLRCHLLPAFERQDLRQLKKAQIEAWKLAQAKRVNAGEYCPATVNNWLKFLRVIVNTAVVDLELPKNPIAGVKDLDRSMHRSYTREEPNSLTRDEVGGFLRTMEALCPQHFAMVLVGFSTGLRPSSLRPLRREGAKADIDWETGRLLVRRSHTRKDEVMDRTKVGKDYVIGLPDEVMDVLKWHVANLPEGPMMDCGLLFPSEDGGFRAGSCLDKPFAAVLAAIGVRKRFTPRGMRRTFHDLADEAKAQGLELLGAHNRGTALGRLYRTEDVEKTRAELGKVVDLMSYRNGAAA